MCRNVLEGGRRCPDSAHKKADQSIRKKKYYQAKKEGLTIEEWAEKHPDDNLALNNLYEKQLNKFALKDADTEENMVMSVSVEEPEHETREEAAERDLTSETLEIIEQEPSFSVPNVNLGELYTNIRREKLIAHGALGKVDEYGFTEDYYCPDSDEIKKESRAELDAIYETLDDPEPYKNALRSYANVNYEYINGYLTGEKTLEQAIHTHDNYVEGQTFKNMPIAKSIPDAENLKEHIEHLDTILAHRKDEVRTVYRGISLNQRHPLIQEALKFHRQDTSEYDVVAAADATFKENQVITFDNFGSTSYDPHFANQWGMTGGTTGHFLFEIKTRSGVNISRLGWNDDEKEVLLPRGIKFKVVGFKERPEDLKDYYWNSNQGIPTRDATVIRLVEVDDDGNELPSGPYKTPPLPDGLK